MLRCMYIAHLVYVAVIKSRKFFMNNCHRIEISKRWIVAFHIIPVVSLNFVLTKQRNNSLQNCITLHTYVVHLEISVNWEMCFTAKP
jgi:hypothetical protein